MYILINSKIALEEFSLLREIKFLNHLPSLFHSVRTLKCKDVKKETISRKTMRAPLPAPAFQRVSWEPLNSLLPASRWHTAGRGCPGWGEGGHRRLGPARRWRHVNSERTRQSPPRAEGRAHRRQPVFSQSLKGLSPPKYFPSWSPFSTGKHLPQKSLQE